jgi:hypothetical protein
VTSGLETRNFDNVQELNANIIGKYLSISVCRCAISEQSYVHVPT